MDRQGPGKWLIAILFAFTGLVQAQQPLTPDDDWVGALRAGGTVILGPGAFNTTEFVELTRSVSVRGQGMGLTSLWFNNSGGEYAEQLALLAGDQGPTRYEFSDLDISNISEVPSDLISVFGNVHLSLNRVSVNYAFEDLGYLSGTVDIWRGSGLWLGQDATGLIEGSIFYANTTHGITARDATRLVVQDSRFFNHLMSGISVINTPATIMRSHFEDNDVGIEIFGTQQTATLVGNTYLGQQTMDVSRQ